MLAWQVMPDQWWTGAVAVLICAVPLGARWLPWERPMHPAWRAAWVAAPTLGFLLGLVLLYSRAAVPFLYFQF
jgi:alginate O-acetyltransferase complex protein AlgI